MKLELLNSNNKQIEQKAGGFLTLGTISTADIQAPQCGVHIAVIAWSQSKYEPFRWIPHSPYTEDYLVHSVPRAWHPHSDFWDFIHQTCPLRMIPPLVILFRDLGLALAQLVRDFK